MNPARALYSVVTWGAQPLLRRKLRRRAVAEPGYGLAIGERFGQYPAPIDSLMPHSSSDPLGRFVWIHAVSLGETRAAAILLAALREQLPGMRLLLTHGTATGRAEGEKLLLPGDVQVWQPWDTPGAVARFLRKFRPAIGVLMETEVWPNLVAGCRRRGVPLVLANARLNAKSLRNAQRLAALARPAYGALTAVWAQTDDDADRLRAIGAQVRGVFGNLKFDVVPDARQLAQGRAWRDQATRPVVMLASSREGEEALWLEIFKQKRPPALIQKAQGAINSEANGAQVAGGVQWLIVPRHPQRFDEVHQLLLRAGLTVSRRSTWAGVPEAADVWLGDSLGEMALYYGLAHVALLGGSFAPLGGQNLIEAAACGCPVVLGPHTFNFAEAAELACSAGAAQRVPDIGAGVAHATALALDSSQQRAASERAGRFATEHRGGAEATARAILEIVLPRAAGAAALAG
ncbi:3-deoxy-D-manno-octulosonic acid transferase [Acidovorax sp. LjRoot129]|uniref:3-deoxy-D-manno-octulosonic acid transferase n=1 Tax=Acidovorax sp. LjRoot129 TaxID=3342260 RepID=UPI003ECE2F60